EGTQPFRPVYHRHASFSGRCRQVRWQPPISALFPYTTLFRSEQPRVLDGDDGLVGEGFEQFDPARRGTPELLYQHGSEADAARRSEEHTSELQSLTNIVCRLLVEKKISGFGLYICEVHRSAVD